MAHIILHGTGAGNPSGDRGASAASVRFADGSVLLLDAGEGCSRAMLRDGLRLNDIATIAVSHTHADHWTGLPNLMMALSLGKRTDPIDLYVPPGSADFFRTVFQTSYILPERTGFELRLHDLGPVPLPDGFRLRPFATSHLDKLRDRAGELALPFPAFGYVLEREGRKILFSQDLGSEDDLAGELPGCDLVICELAHVDPARLLALASAAGVRNVVFTHVPPEMPDMSPAGRHPDWMVASDGTILSLE